MSETKGGASMREKFALARCWYMGKGATNQEQVMAQQMAEREFDFFCQQAKLLSIVLSPIKRTWRITNDEDGRPLMATYYQRVYAEGSDDCIQTLKDTIDKKRPPVFAELLKQAVKP
jgi:hypothetical protein